MEPYTSVTVSTRLLVWVREGSLTHYRVYLITVTIGGAVGKEGGEGKRGRREGEGRPRVGGREESERKGEVGRRGRGREERERG